MLSSVLTSEVAINVSIRIMDAFVEIRHTLAANAIVFQRLEKLEEFKWKADKNFQAIFKKLEEPREKKAFAISQIDDDKQVAEILKRLK